MSNNFGVINALALWKTGYLRPDIPEGIDFANGLSNVLRETGALLAGGSVLSIIHKKYIHDLDIYVQLSNSKKILDFLRDNDFSVYSINIAPAYDQSFFRKNRIIERVVCSGLARGNTIFIDIMIIPDEVQPVEVTSNFDLTFCEIWYDGVAINGTDMQGSLEKRGRVREEYLDSLLNHFNKFIAKRIIKYTEKGYRISYSCKGNYDIAKAVKMITSPEDWVTSKLYHLITQILSENLQIAIWTLEFPLLNYSLEGIRAATQNVMGKLRINMDILEFWQSLVFPMIVALKQPYLGYMMEFLQFPALSGNLEFASRMEENEQEIRNAAARYMREVRSMRETAMQQEATTADIEDAERRMLARQEADRAALTAAAERMAGMNIEPARATVWQRLCDLETISEQDRSRLSTIRDTMNRVLMEGTGSTPIDSGNRAEQICQDLNNIVRSYKAWVEEMLPGCINDSTMLGDDIGDLGFGELIVIPTANNPNQYHCFSIEEINGISNSGDRRNPYNQQQISRILIDRAASFANLLTNYYEGEGAEELEEAPVVQLENLLRLSNPYVPSLETKIQGYRRMENIADEMENLTSNPILNRALQDLGLQETTRQLFADIYDEGNIIQEVATDFYVKMLLPIAQIEDEDTSTRRMAIIDSLYPDML